MRTLLKKKSLFLASLGLAMLTRVGLAAEVEVTASALNVRTSAGAVECVVPKGTKLEATGKHADGFRLQVKIDAPGCPKEGYVYSSYVERKDELPAAKQANVHADRLSFRSSPDSNPSSRKCLLPKNTKLDVSEVGSTWVKVSLPAAVAGCPKDGYVAKFYLDPPDRYADLSVVEGTTQSDCAVCNKLAALRATGNSVDTMSALSDGIGRSLSDTTDSSRQGRATRFAMLAYKAANKCRPYAPHVCARRTGSRRPCGSSCGITKSKGWCKAAVREAGEEALGFTIPGGDANAARSTLEKAMTKIPAKSCADGPIGTVCLYTGGGFGHIEVKTFDPKTRQVLYCSDFCMARPIRNRKFSAAYYPK